MNKFTQLKVEEVDEVTIEEIIRGESKNVEFKVALPKDTEKYIKTIIAFANTQGGQLIVGVDDKTSVKHRRSIGRTSAKHR